MEKKWKLIIAFKASSATPHPFTRDVQTEFQFMAPTTGHARGMADALMQNFGSTRNCHFVKEEFFGEA